MASSEGTRKKAAGGGEQAPEISIKGQNSTHRLYEFLRNDEYVDITLKTEDGGRISCHKCILASKSDYFHSLFSGGMKESHENDILLQDISIDDLGKVIEFIYTSQCSFPCTSFVEMLLAADKMLLEDLRQLLIQEFIRRCEKKEGENLALLIFDVWRLYTKADHLFRASSITPSLLKRFQQTLIQVLPLFLESKPDAADGRD